MISRKERIEMDKISISDRIRWFLNDDGYWIFVGFFVGTLPFVPDYIAFFISIFI